MEKSKLPAADPTLHALEVEVLKLVRETFSVASREEKIKLFWQVTDALADAIEGKEETR